MTKRRTDADIAAESRAAVDEVVADFMNLPPLTPSSWVDLSESPLIARLESKYSKRPAKSTEELARDAADLLSWLANVGEQRLRTGLPLPVYAVIISLREKAQCKPSILDKTTGSNRFKSTAHAWIRARARAVATLGCGVLNARPSDCTAAIARELSAANYRPASGSTKVEAPSVARWLWATSLRKDETDLRRDAILDYSISYGWSDGKWDASTFAANTSLKKLSASLRVLCNSLVPVDER
jgi:hypothetical protein